MELRRLIWPLMFMLVTTIIIVGAYLLGHLDFGEVVMLYLAEISIMMLLWFIKVIVIAVADDWQSLSLWGRLRYVAMGAAGIAFFAMAAAAIYFQMSNVFLTLHEEAAHVERLNEGDHYAAAAALWPYLLAIGIAQIVLLLREWSDRRKIKSVSIEWGVRFLSLWAVIIGSVVLASNAEMDVGPGLSVGILVWAFMLVKLTVDLVMLLFLRRDSAPAP